MFAVAFYGLSKFLDEFRVFEAECICLIAGEKFSVQIVSFFAIGICPHLVLPLRFLAVKPFPKTGLSRLPAFAAFRAFVATPLGKFRPLDVALRWLILITFTQKT